MIQYTLNTEQIWHTLARTHAKKKRERDEKNQTDRREKKTRAHLIYCCYRCLVISRVQSNCAYVQASVYLSLGLLLLVFLMLFFEILLCETVWTHFVATNILTGSLSPHKFSSLRECVSFFSFVFLILSTASLHPSLGALCVLYFSDYLRFLRNCATLLWVCIFGLGYLFFSSLSLFCFLISFLCTFLLWVRASLVSLLSMNWVGERVRSFRRTSFAL